MRAQSWKHPRQQWGGRARVGRKCEGQPPGLPRAGRASGPLCWLPVQGAIRGSSGLDTSTTSDSKNPCQIQSNIIAFSTASPASPEQETAVSGPQRTISLTLTSFPSLSSQEPYMTILTKCHQQPGFFVPPPASLLNLPHPTTHFLAPASASCRAA